MGKIKRIILVLAFLLLLYTRFVGLDWGLPYPFHPDERNMTIAVQQLDCSVSDLKNCLNPRFFAYGQFSLYLAYGLSFVMKLVDGDLNTPVGFQEATIALRLISAAASVILAYFIVRIVQLIAKARSDILLFLATLSAVIFSPALIQFAHFGTTESLLMLFYTWLIYESLLFYNKKITLKHFIVISSIVSGLALATKVSSLIFSIVPAIIILSILKRKIGKALGTLFLYGLLTLLIGIVFSPHNLLSFNEFMGALRYESEVALGTSLVFYTRQFAGSIPIVFQFLKVFPYALGLPVLLLFLLGFFILPVNKNYNILRVAFLIYFVPNAFLYAKWARFMAPIIPLMLIIGILFLFLLLDKIKRANKYLIGTLTTISILLTIIPGIAYLSIYQRQDVRLTASAWIRQNVAPDSFILSETANVVDIPVGNPNALSIISFNFYDLDQEAGLQAELASYIDRADYIFVPSRRLFANHQNEHYPRLNDYYTELFSGALGFEKVAEFSPYPKISFLGKTLIEFPDEQAEETWTVFDHPVVRIYKRSEKL